MRPRCLRRLRIVEPLPPERMIGVRMRGFVGVVAWIDRRGWLGVLRIPTAMLLLWLRLRIEPLVLRRITGLARCRLTRIVRHGLIARRILAGVGEGGLLSLLLLGNLPLFL